MIEVYDTAKHKIVYGGEVIPLDYFGDPKYSIAYDRVTKRFLVVTTVPVILNPSKHMPALEYP